MSANFANLAQVLSQLPTVNWKDALESVGGDRDFLLECLDDLILEARTSEQQIEDAIKAIDFKGVKTAAHKIKGSAAYLFCKPLEEVCAQVNVVSVEGIKSGVGMHNIEILFQLYSRFLNEVEAELNEHKNRIQLDMINVHEVFIPGRLCVLGEHSDWAAQHRITNTSIALGSTIVCATNEGLHARCGRFKEDHFRFDSCDFHGKKRSFEGPMSSDFLKHIAHRGEFFSYIQGTVNVILKTKQFAMRTASLVTTSSTPTLSSNNNNNNNKFGSTVNPSVVIKPQQTKSIPGIYIENYKSTLPIGKGLSSSAAVCVLVATCFNLVYEVGWNREEIMEIAYLGEMCTPSRCGRMDQCVAMGSGSIGFMSFDHDHRSLALLPCKQPLYFVVADLNASKNTSAILKELQKAFPVPKNTTEELAHDYMHEMRNLSYEAIAAIETGDVKSLGSCMNAAQKMFDRCLKPNCPEHLTAPRLHAIMNNQQLLSIAVAVKGVGSQGDGSVQVLCQNEPDQTRVLELLETLYCDGFALTVPASLPSIERPLLSPFQVKSALIIIDIDAYKNFPFLNGYSPPCLMPVLFGFKEKEIVKPCLYHLLQELVANGISRIAVVYGYSNDIDDSDLLPITTSMSDSNSGLRTHDISMLIKAVTQTFLYESDFDNSEHSVNTYQDADQPYEYTNIRLKNLLKNVRFMLDRDIQSDSQALVDITTYLCGRNNSISNTNNLFNNTNTTYEDNASMLILKGELVLGNIKSKREPTALRSFISQSVIQNQKIQLFNTAITSTTTNNNTTTNSNGYNNSMNNSNHNNSIMKNIFRPVALGYTRDSGELIQVGTDKRGLYSRTAEDEIDGSITGRSNQNNSAAKKRKTTEYGTPFFGMAVIPNTKMIDYANRAANNHNGNNNNGQDMIIGNTSNSYDWPVKYHPIDLIISNILQQDLHQLNLEQPTNATAAHFIGVPVSGDSITALANDNVYKEIMKRSLGVPAPL